VAALLVLVPIIAVLLLNVPTLRFGTRVALALAGTLCAAEAVAAVFVPAGAWARTDLPAWIDLPRLLGVALPVDDLGRVMLLAIAIVGVSSTLVARYVRTGREDAFRFSNLLLLAVAAMNGIVLVRDLFALYVFLEITAIASLVLIVLERGKTAFEGAFKYMVLSAVATALLLVGIALLLIVSGGTSFEEVAAGLRAAGTSRLALVAMGLFLGGLAIKAGLAPFHGWLPDAYASAPSAVSVLLAGIVTKTTGVYTLVRLVDAVFGYGVPVRRILLAAGLLSVIAGAIGALAQRDLKRMLAYSSISQVGYIVLGLAAGPGLGFAGAVFHLFNHAVFKTLLFVNASAVEREAGTRDMGRLGGLGAAMPITGATSVVAMLSTAGLPPSAGFWSKLLVVIALWKAGHAAVAAVAVLASVLTLGYLLSMQRRVFLGPAVAGRAPAREVSGWGLAPAVLLAAVTLGLGLAAPWLFETFLLPVGSIL
jgi:proton-translocating NADH-quinone oxidoreductase chain N